MPNDIENSPIALEDADLWSSAPEVPSLAMSTLGAKGNLYVSGETTYGLAETTEGDFVFSWFAGNASSGDRRETGIRTTNAFQVPSLDENGRAIVLADDGSKVFAIEQSGKAVLLGSATGARFSRASWLNDGIVLGDHAGCIHIYQGTEAPLKGVGQFVLEPFEDFRIVDKDVLVVCNSESVKVYSIAEDVRVLASFSTEFHTTFQCMDETGRALWLMPGAHISDGGSFAELTNLKKALIQRSKFPALERLSDAESLTVESGASGTGASVEPAVSPSETTKVEIKEPRTSEYWTYTNALLAMMKANGTRLAEPSQAVLECLALPMDEELYAYVHFRAHWDVGVVAIYEAWLDAPPSLVENRIELGILANGDHIYVRDRNVIELSHEGEGERMFGSFESWLRDVTERTSDETDLHPYLKPSPSP